MSLLKPVNVMATLVGPHHTHVVKAFVVQEDWRASAAVIVPSDPSLAWRRRARNSGLFASRRG